VTLRDGNRSVQGRAFRRVRTLASAFDSGDVVRITGRVIQFRGIVQIELHTIARTEIARPDALLPASYRDIDELDGFLEHLAREEIGGQPYRALLDALLRDEKLRREWRRAPCTANGHHAYLGGLLEHSVAVGVLAVETCTLHPALDDDLLVTAALVHDIGKTRAFSYEGVIAEIDDARERGHGRVGLALLRTVADACRMPAGLWRALAGCHRPGR
jgi:3'-5' exoribonuclease